MESFKCGNQGRIQDFPGGANNKRGVTNLLFGQIFMKMKKIGPRGGGASPKYYYADPPLATAKC